MDTGIGVNEDAFGGKALGAVTGNGVAVVEMTMLVGVELDLVVVVEADRYVTIDVDRLDGGHVAICNAEQFVGGSKLDAFTYGELSLDLSVDADACKAAGIVGRKLSARFLDREFVCGWVDRDNRCVGGGFDSDDLSSIRPGEYSLGVRQPSLGWTRYPIRVF